MHATTAYESLPTRPPVFELSFDPRSWWPLRILGPLWILAAGFGWAGRPIADAIGETVPPLLGVVDYGPLVSALAAFLMALAALVHAYAATLGRRERRPPAKRQPRKPKE